MSSTQTRGPAREPAYSGWERALARADELIEDSQRFDSFLDLCVRRLLNAQTRRGPLKQNWQHIFTMLRLLDSYRYGCYTDLPRASLTLMVAAFSYFVSTFDAIPDFLPVVGWRDAAAVFSYVIGQVADELECYERWVAAAWA